MDLHTEEEDNPRDGLTVDFIVSPVCVSVASCQLGCSCQSSHNGIKWPGHRCQPGSNDMLDCSHMLLSEVVGKLAQLGDHIDDVRSRSVCQVGRHPDCLLVWEVGIWHVRIRLAELG